MARQLELEVEPQDVGEHSQQNFKTGTMPWWQKA
jgi:hypothetical protein